MRIVNITFAGEYKPGDPPPEGYLQWHAWADVQAEAGLEQRQCCDCSLWKFPQEMSDITRTSYPRTSDGKVHPSVKPVCKKCAERKGELA